MIEYILRVAFNQPGKDEFFPISLVASGISLNVAATAFAGEMDTECSKRWAQAIAIANLGIFASLIGVLLWMCWLVASFNAEVKGILPVHPLFEYLVYYLFSLFLTERKAKLARC